MGVMDRYAVIGNPVEHSLSPIIHAAFAKQTQQSMTYTKILAPLDRFSETVLEFIQQGGKGANITLPFKTNAFTLATQHSSLAMQARAANTLVFGDNHSIFADSTDGLGLVRDLTHNHSFKIKKKTIIILGAGGACQTILGPLLQASPTVVHIANRTKQKAIDIAKQFSNLGSVHSLGLDEIEKSPYDLVINATSIGLTSNAVVWPSNIIDQHTWCYDLVYAKGDTSFISWAKTFHPAYCLDGLGMLIEQAAFSFYIWRGVHPDTQPIYKLLKDS